MRPKLQKKELKRQNTSTAATEDKNKIKIQRTLGGSPKNLFNFIRIFTHIGDH